MADHVFNRVLIGVQILLVFGRIASKLGPKSSRKFEENTIYPGTFSRTLHVLRIAVS